MKRLLKEYGSTLGMIWGACFIVFIFAYALLLKPQIKTKKALGEKLEQQKQDYIAAHETSQDATKKRLLKEVSDLENNLREYVTDANGSANLTFENMKPSGISNYTASAASNALPHS